MCESLGGHHTARKRGGEHQGGDGGGTHSGDRFLDEMNEAAI